MADNTTHILAVTATVKLTFNDVEVDVVIRNGRTPEESISNINIRNCPIEIAAAYSSHICEQLA